MHPSFALKNRVLACCLVLVSALICAGCNKSATGKFVSPRSSNLYVDLQSGGKAFVQLETSHVMVKYEVNGSDLTVIDALGGVEHGIIGGDHLSFEGSDLYREGSDALKKAAFTFESDRCCSNLKILAVAAQLWTVDHNGYPTSLLQLKPNLLNPSILVCPSDYAHAASARKSWQQFTEGEISYKLAPPDNKPIQEHVLIRCPVHGNVCKADGSVIKANTLARPN